MPRRIHLGKFVSRYAEPGERVAWPTFSSSLSLTDSGNHLAQAQRRKNWRILMEACLVANGGTGQHNGTGWYASQQTGTGINISDAGEVYIPGPLMFEPYNDGQYAPNWVGDLGTERFWTLPGGVRIVGSGATQGDIATGGWGEVNPRASRLICWDNYVGWYPRGGPAISGGGARRHVSNWSIDKIGVMRKGTIAGPVFFTGHWTENNSGPVAHFSQFWHIGDVLVDMHSGGVYTDGVVIRCGLTCRVDRLRIMGHSNEGWGLIYTGSYLNPSPATPNPGALQARSTTVKWRQVVVHGSGKGVATHMADFFCDELNIEQSASQTGPKQRFVIGENCDVDIGMYWSESLRPVVSGHNAVVVIGQSTADCISEGIIPAGTTATSTTAANVRVGYVRAIGAVDGEVLGAAFKLLNGNLTVGPCRAANVTTVFQQAPTVADGNVGVTYNSNALQLYNVANIITGTELGSYPVRGKVVDLAKGDHAQPWVTLPHNSLMTSTAYGGRYWNRGNTANSLFRLPVGTAADVGKRVTVMKFDDTYTFRVNTSIGFKINAATNANPCQLTVDPLSGQTLAAAGYATGQKKWVTGVGGMTELNGRLFTITVTGDYTLTLGDPNTGANVDSTTYGTFAASGSDRVGGQIIGNRDSGATVAIHAFLTPVTFEYVGDDLYVIVDGLDPEMIKPTVKTLPTGGTVLVSDSGKLITSRGQSSDITRTLPSGTTGLLYHFRRESETYAVTIAPNGSQRIGHGGSGKALTLSHYGAEICIEWVNGRWEFRRILGLIEFAP